MSLSYLSLELFDKNLLDFRGRKKRYLFKNFPEAFQIFA